MVKNNKKNDWYTWFKRLNGFKKFCACFFAFIMLCGFIVVLDITIKGDDMRQVSMHGLM